MLFLIISVSPVLQMPQILQLRLSEKHILTKTIVSRFFHILISASPDIPPVSSQIDKRTLFVSADILCRIYSVLCNSLIITKAGSVKEICFHICRPVLSFQTFLFNLLLLIICNYLAVCCENAEQLRLFYFYALYSTVACVYFS